jgi:hypothetical protein
MAAEEGLRRLRLIINGLFYAGIGLMVLGIVLAIILHLITSSVNFPVPLMLIILGVYLAAASGLLRITFWVVEGFLMRTATPLERPADQS